MTANGLKKVQLLEQILKKCYSATALMSSMAGRTEAPFSKQKPVTVFELQGQRSEPSDTEFRVGLQLLIGMLEKDGES